MESIDYVHLLSLATKDTYGYTDCSKIGSLAEAIKDISREVAATEEEHVRGG